MENENKVTEMSRVRQEGRFFVVEILSAATGRWIVQGEFLSNGAAQRDLRNWR